jgi:hypothetical protein
MRKQILKKILFTLIIFTLGSCNDPIFKTISQEVKQLEPHIKGSPTNFVVFNNKMYVASGTTLYRYDGTKSGKPGEGNWYDILNVGNNGNIWQLAQINDTTMYALCGRPGNNVIKRSNNGSAWVDISVPAEISVQRIYAANNELFIGAAGVNTYAIYRLDGNDFLLLKETGNRLLNGAAFDGTNYFLIAKDIYTETGSTYKFVSGGTTEINSSIPFMGILRHGSVIFAISRDGMLYNVTSAAVSQTGRRLNDGGSNNRDATGALAVWTDNTSHKLLLAGRADVKKNSVNYLYGYQELELDSSGNIIGTFNDPGLNPFSTINDNAPYKTNMEKNPVNYLYQAGDGILFASTQAKGVWSYRLRGDRWLWNAEQ